MKISQPTKLPFPAPLFTCPAFDFLTSFGHFLVFFLFCPPVIAFAFGFFGILYEGLAIKAPRLDTVRSSSLIKFLFGWEAFSTSRSFPVSLIFSHFLGSQTPSEDGNSEDEWLETLPP